MTNGEADLREVETLRRERDEARADVAYLHVVANLAMTEKNHRIAELEAECERLRKREREREKFRTQRGLTLGEPF